MSTSTPSNVSNAQPYLIFFCCTLCTLPTTCFIVTTMKIALIAAVATSFVATGAESSFSGDVITSASNRTCSATSYCCPDAKHCLTPTKVSCKGNDGSADASVCSSDQTCCPLTLLCVDVGAPCTPVCEGSYCCPDALKCLKPTNPGTLCASADDCEDGTVCCPLTHLCTKPLAPCTPEFTK